MEYESSNLFTPNSSKNMYFSPFSCGSKKALENFFDMTTKETSPLLQDPLNQLLMGSPLFNMDFIPSPVSIGGLKNNYHKQQDFSFNQIPTLELPLKIQNKFDNQTNNIKEIKRIKIKREIPTIQIEENKREVKKVINTIPKVENRRWIVVYSNTNDFYMNVFSKTRCDKPSEEVDEVLYSSLKYEIKQNLYGNFNYKFILAKIYAVDSITGDVILKNNNSVLKGTIQCTIAISTEEKNEITGTLKVQFTDVSYHHKKGDICWEISYFQPDDLNNPLLKVRSAPFKVFARKPSTEAKKRKKDDVDDSFTKFTNSLEELVKYTKKLKTQDKNKALNLINLKIQEFEKNMI